MKIEIAEARIQRLYWKPGDRLIVRTDEKLDAATADRLREVICARLGIPSDARLVILDRGMSVEVVEGLDAAD